MLKGETKDGESSRASLKYRTTGASSQKLWIEPSDAEPLDAVKRALSEAEVIVLGPGSLFTSVMPNLLLTEMAALRAT